MKIFYKICGILEILYGTLLLYGTRQTVLAYGDYRQITLMSIAYMLLVFVVGIFYLNTNLGNKFTNISIIVALALIFLSFPLIFLLEESHGEFLHYFYTLTFLIPVVFSFLGMRQSSINTR